MQEHAYPEAGMVGTILESAYHRFLPGSDAHGATSQKNQIDK